MPKTTTTTYTCQHCEVEFKQKSHYDRHITKKNGCVPIDKMAEAVEKPKANPKKSVKKPTPEVDPNILATINQTINKDALKEYIHDIHNMLRNNGAGYGMNALKVFMVFYVLWILEKKDMLKKYGLEDCTFSMLRKLAEQKQEESIVADVHDSLTDAIHKSKELRPFFYTEIPGEVTGNTMKELILQIHNLPSVENVEGQLCGKIYEYFIGRDQTAISELGAYFTDRHITNYIFNLLDIQLKDDGSIPTMIDYFGGSGGFTVGYANHMKDKYPEIDWKTQINNIYHFDMNEDVTKYAALELLSITDQIPDDKHIRVTNTFKHEFNRQYDLPIINPPYGGDNIKPSKDSKVRQTIVNYIKSIDNPTEQQKTQRKTFEEFIKREKKERDAQKVHLGNSSTFIQQYAKEHKLSGNDKEAISLILLMATTAVNGTACAVLKQGVFFDKKYSELRKHLIENFEVTDVIKIDNKQFENTGTTTSIIKFHNTPDNTTKKIVFRELIVERFTEDKFDITEDGFVRLLECEGDIKETYDKLKSEATIEELRAETGKKKKIQMYSLDGSKYGIKPLKCKEGYKRCLLGDIGKVYTGSSIKSQYLVGDVPYYGSNSIIGHTSIIQYSGKYIITGRVGTVGTYKMVNEDFSLCDNAFCIRGNDSYVTDYLFYIIQQLSLSNVGSVVNLINKSDLENFEIPIPTSKQKIKEWSDRISKPYNEYVEKTELVKKLEQEVQEKIQKMIEEEECDEYKLGDICEFIKSKTKLVAADGKIKGLHRFYTSSQDKLLYRDDYEHEGKNILIGRGGNVSLHLATKFSVSCDDVYILDTSDIPIDFVYYYLVAKKDNISETFQGSTLKHSSKGALNKLSVKIPKDKSKLNDLNQYYDNIEKNKTEAQEAEKKYKNLIQQLKADALEDDV